ncbi:sensor histidine kinase [Terribacillus halophilus]|jgi:signal transduction histidine kinase|uniref:sensor histidine kinase n=1 Tax=Terribacillus halophilus TaxID=361279 RepID=UPI000986FEE1|nr:ATP-binding protein [Terribacillus halophilus]
MNTVIVLTGLLVVSLFINLLLFKSKRSVEDELKYIENKLRQITYVDERERILQHTSNQAVKNLLIQLNILLDRNHQIAADYMHIERSMRKMLSNISHDLKTPLTVILGYIEIAESDLNLEDETLVSTLATLKLKSTEVLRLIERFFELAKLESGDKDIQLRKLDICEISRKVILDFSSILEKKQFDVIIEIPEHSFYVMGNEEAIIRVLNNLLSNAITYGAEGNMIGFKISKKKDTVCMEVYDKGKGIHESHQNDVFERMYTMEDSRNKHYQGSGLGLTISKRLVEQMGGSISLHSVPYIKTTFKVSLKLIK